MIKKNCKKILCRDINGDVHIVSKTELIQRTSVYGVIKGDNGILLVRDRTRTDEKWDLPGGGIESHEEIVSALHREIKEETSLDIINEPRKICEFVEYFYDVDTQKGWESTRHFYKVATNGTPQMDGNEDDITAAQYFKAPFSPQDVAAVAREIIAMAERL